MKLGMFEIGSVVTERPSYVYLRRFALEFDLIAPSFLAPRKITDGLENVDIPASPRTLG